MGGICRTRRVGWCHCHELLGCDGGCAGLGAFGLGQMTGPVAKVFWGLAGLWVGGGGLGAVHLRSSTSLANFLIADRMSSDGVCSSDGFAFVWQYSSCMRLSVQSGSTAWMDNMFRVAMAFLRVL